MEDLSAQVVEALKTHREINSKEFAASNGGDHNAVVGILKSLESTEVVVLESARENEWALKDEGRQYIQDGSPEWRFFHLIPEDPEGAPLTELVEAFKALGFDDKKAKMTQGQLMSRRWVARKGDKANLRLARGIVPDCDIVREQLANLSTLAKADLTALKKRNLVEMRQVTVFTARPGPEFAAYCDPSSRKQETVELTHEMLASGQWHDMSFKRLNIQAAGKLPPSGHLHPLMKMRSLFRQIFFSLGYTEMDTSRYVESSFWNFDALYQPQAHPARDLHDTFFMRNPADALSLPEALVERVQAMHEHGGDQASLQSTGWQYDWKISEARRNLLRTHTTAVSSRVLFYLAQNPLPDDAKFPVKFFSIDRVFRNETLDATHLAEFHQIEGMVIAKDLTLANLMGELREFFERIGLSQIRFKPAYNPYTEPSMEIFAFHPLLNKSIEIGNTGIFRPEMTVPLGLPRNVRILAWGLSLERPTMIRYGFDNIRSLCGHKMDIGLIANTPIRYLSKE